MMNGGIHMNEEFEIAKAEMKNAEMYNDILNNPVIQTLLCGIKSIPIISDLVINTISVAVEAHQRKKLQKLMTLIIEDNTITEEMVNDVDVIMEFAKMVDVVNRLRTSQKIEYLANLFKNMVKDSDRDYDEYEEYLQKLNDLSWRELELLFLLEEAVQSNLIETVNTVNSNGEVFEESEGYNAEKVWDSFLKLSKESTELEEGMITSIISGTMRSGFVQHISILYPGTAVTVYVTTTYFRRLLERIKTE